MFGWGSQDSAECLATMRYALNAASTGSIPPPAGSGSRGARRGFLRALPVADRPFVFTSGLPWNAHDRMPNPGGALKPASIQRECEASLRRLGVERIELYQLD